MHRFKNPFQLTRRVIRWNGFWWMVAVLGAAVAGFAFSWLYWDELHGPRDSLSTVIRNLGFVIGGVIAILLTVWRSTIAGRQAETSQHSLLNERYQRGAEMLGSSVLTVRLGGIYALETLAREHIEQYHIPIVQLLCAFARNPPSIDPEAGNRVGLDDRPVLREDVHAAVRAVANRSASGVALEEKIREDIRVKQEDPEFIVPKWYLRREPDHAELDLRQAQLAGADLMRANFAGANLDGANLNHARLRSADLREANLSRANLREADLVGANLSEAQLSSADLSNALAVHANMSGATLACKMIDAELYGADFSYASFTYAELSGANLGSANLTGARFDVGTEILTTTMPSGEGVEETRFIYAELTQRQLDEALADPEHPPFIEEGTLDVDTGDELVWRG